MRCRYTDRSARPPTPSRARLCLALWRGRGCLAACSLARQSGSYGRLALARRDDRNQYPAKNTVSATPKVMLPTGPPTIAQITRQTVTAPKNSATAPVSLVRIGQPSLWNGLPWHTLHASNNPTGSDCPDGPGLVDPSPSAAAVPSDGSWSTRVRYRPAAPEADELTIDSQIGVRSRGLSSAARRERGDVSSVNAPVIRKCSWPTPRQPLPRGPSRLAPT